MKKKFTVLLALCLVLALLSSVITTASAASFTADDTASLANSAQQAIGKSAADLGLPAGDWCGYFVVNRMNNSQISAKLGITPYNVCAYAISLVSWICATKDAGVFYVASPVHQSRLLEIDPRLGSNGRMVSRTSSGWTPLPGDILQFSWSNWNLHTFDHTGIVVSVNGDTITYVDGNSSAGRVAAHTIRKDSSTIIGHIRFNIGNDIPPSNPPQYFDCDVWIACVYGQVVNLYNNPGDSRRSDYFSLGQSVPSTYGAKLSDGSTWYRITANSLGVDRTFWLKAENGKMTITDLSQPTVCSHNWNAGAVIKEPTLTSTGVRRYTCTLCGATRDEEIPAKDTISGRWSDTAGWTFSASTGTLTVSGTGEFGLYGLGKENEPSVKHIVVNEGITSLRMGAFSGLSNVVSVELPRSLTTIESTAFCRCTSLKEITLPPNVSEVKANAFQQCTALQNIYVDSQNAWYRSVDGVLFTKDMKTLLCFPYARSGSYQIPDGVTDLEYRSFSWCDKLSSVTIPESVTNISKFTFCGEKYDVWDTSTFCGIVRVYKGSYGETYVKSKAEDGLKYEIIDKCANGHTWDNGQVTTEATTTSPGVRTYTCTVCKATRTETIPTLPAPTSGGLQNFVDSHTYYNGLFRDVAADAWYSGNVAAVYRLGLMKGTGANIFAPGKNVTIAETVTLAARLHSIYHTGKDTFDAYDDGNWYDPYVNYARNNGIISENYNYDLPATRETFAHILAQALPSSVLRPTRAESIRFADAGRIVYAGDVELLCKAGVINGVQSGGVTNFLPQNTITRAEASAIITRMAKPDLRIK